MKLFSYLTGLNEGGELKDAMVAKLGLKQAMDSLPDHANIHDRAQKRCMTCNNAADCARWLATENAPDEAPDYCKNHDLFERITDKIEARSA
jgi:Family of unknown function (DUF6455)